MTDTETTQEFLESLPNQEVSTDSAAPVKDEGLAQRHGYIDFDQIENEEVRQQVQDRLNGLYRDQKIADQATSEMRRLYGNMEKEVASLKESKEKEKAEAQLAEVRKGLADAQSRGEYEKAAQFTEKLTELKQPKPVAQPQERSDDLSVGEQNALLSWQAEMTEDGRIARPWANPGSPKYRQTIAELTKAYADPNIASQGFQAVLQSVHEKMAPKAKPATPVADGDTTPTRRTKQVSLTPDQERIARKMYPNEKDPVAAYAKARKLYGDK